MNVVAEPRPAGLVDGNFLFQVPVEDLPPRTITVVLNWQRLLQRSIYRGSAPESRIVPLENRVARSVAAAPPAGFAIPEEPGDGRIASPE